MSALPRKRTLIRATYMSALCQKQTLAVVRPTGSHPDPPELHSSTRILGSFVIIVIIAQPAGLRVNCDFAGFAVHRSGHFHVSAVAGDHDVGPSVRLQLRFDLLRGDWTIARYKNRSWLLRSRNHEAGACDQQGTASETYDKSSHGSLLRGSVMHEVSKAVGV